MSDLFKNAQSRRAFLRKLGLGGAAVGLMSTTEARAMLTRLRASDKPLLTEQTLNQFIMNAAQDPDLYARYAEQAAADLKGFLMPHFEIAESTIAAIDAMPRREHDELREGIEASGEALANDWDTPEAMPLYMRFVAPMPSEAAKAPPVDVDVSTGGDTDTGDAGGDITVTKTITVTIFNCSGGRRRRGDGFWDPAMPDPRLDPAAGNPGDPRNPTGPRMERGY